VLNVLIIDDGIVSHRE